MWSAIVSTLRQSLDVFESTAVASSTNYGCDFTAKSLRESAHTIYLIVKDIDRERLAPLMAIVFSSLSSGLLSDLPKENSKQVSFILDEFVRLGRLESILDMPAIGRGYKFNAMFIAQDYGQIIDIYKKEKLSALESNTGYKIVLSQNNADTAKSIAEQIGYATRLKESDSVSTHTKDVINKGRSKNITREAYLLMSHQDIMNMEKGEGVVLVQHHFRHPIKITLPFYFKEPKFKRLLDA
jgi:type IV secretion system protein VirD4